MIGYVEEKSPGFLKRKFSQDWQPRMIERAIAIELGMKPEIFWREIDAVVVAPTRAITPGRTLIILSDKEFLRCHTRSKKSALYCSSFKTATRPAM
jgi:hypothetical protein